MITKIDTKLLHSLRRWGFGGEELNWLYQFFSSFPKPLASLIWDLARNSQGSRRPHN